MMRRSTPVAGAVGLVLVLAGCGGAADDAGADVAASQTPSTAPSPGPGGEIPVADAMFAAAMIPHHETGIQLTAMALEKATTPGVREVAQRADASQKEQIPQLEQIAESAGMAPAPPEPPMQEFNQQEMAELGALQGEDFDRKWLDVFSSHHMSAIMMADIALSTEDDGGAQTLEQEIHDGQLADLEQMNALRAELG